MKLYTSKKANSNMHKKRDEQERHYNTEVFYNCKIKNHNMAENKHTYQNEDILQTFTA